MRSVLIALSAVVVAVVGVTSAPRSFAQVSLMEESGALQPTVQPCDSVTSRIYSGSGVTTFVADTASEALSGAIASLVGNLAGIANKTCATCDVEGACISTISHLTSTITTSVSQMSSGQWMGMATYSGSWRHACTACEESDD